MQGVDDDRRAPHAPCAAAFIVRLRKLLLPPSLCSTALLSLRNVGVTTDYHFGSFVIPTYNATLPSLLRRPRPRVRFVPFPHKSLGSGEDAACTWTTRSVPPDSSEQYDAIQRAAFEEGMCLPTRPGAPSLHVFSTAEARECLSPARQGRNISVTVSGDSYTRQMFIGLADVLLGRPSKEEIRLQKVRLDTLEASNRELAHRHGNDTSFPKFQYQCFGECYGIYDDNHLGPFSPRCATCMNIFTQSSPHSVGVVGAGIHVLRYFGQRKQKENGRPGETEARPERVSPWAIAHADSTALAAVDDTIDDIRRFLDLANRTIYVSVPSYERSKVPKEYRNASHHTLSEVLYEGLLESLAPRNERHPFIDVFQLTKACNYKNCSYDGGHRARYVNRWKAQLLLNTVCEVHDN